MHATQVCLDIYPFSGRVRAPAARRQLRLFMRLAEPLGLVRQDFEEGRPGPAGEAVPAARRPAGGRLAAAALSGYMAGQIWEMP
jgi:hypothetical protein